jgi:hypothetical protein
MAHPVRTRSILTDEQQRELVKDYRAGMKRVDISAKYDLKPTQIYAYLRQNGVEANRRADRRRVVHFCVVCGDVIPMPPYSPSNGFRPLATCNDPACVSLALFRPDMRQRLPLTRGRQRPEYNDDEEVIYTVERGKDIPLTARRSLWGRLSELSVAVRMYALGTAETAITLPRRNPVGEFLRRFFGNNPKAAVVKANAFDVLYLWRCNCPNQKSYVIRSLAEFPRRADEYGVCPRCTSTALVIE